jgi:hypothetical protein
VEVQQIKSNNAYRYIYFVLTYTCTGTAVTAWDWKANLFGLLNSSAAWHGREIFLVNMGVDSQTLLILNHNKNIHRYHSRPSARSFIPYI